MTTQQLLLKRNKEIKSKYDAFKSEKLNNKTAYQKIVDEFKEKGQPLSANTVRIICKNKKYSNSPI